MKICVIGQGYIGIPTSVLFAKNNCEVIGVDIDKDKVDKINKGQIPIEEPKLQEILTEVINDGSYVAKMEPELSDTYIVTVPTPFNKEDFSCNLNYVTSACKSILSLVKRNDVIIIESTIAPLSMENVVKPIFEKEGFRIGEDLYLAHCPERVLPGNVVNELIYNNRIVGGITRECAEKAAEVYRIFVKGPIIETEAKVAEMSKCMENTFRDVNIALANELTKICYKLDINVLEVIKLANQHPRVNIHSPGPGVGGHCLAIDPYFIYSLVPDEAKIIKLARETNNSMPFFVVNQINRILSCKNADERLVVSIFGISYKGNSDDDRESPSYEIIKLLEDSYEIRIYDPHIPTKSLEYEEAITDSDLIVVLTNHDEFKKLDYDKIIEKMEEPIIFDTKNVIDEGKIPSTITLINFGNLNKI